MKKLIMIGIIISSLFIPVKEDVKTDVKENVKEDVIISVKEDTKEDVKEDTKEDVKEDTKEDVKEDTKKETKKEDAKEDTKIIKKTKKTKKTKKEDTEIIYNNEFKIKYDNDIDMYNLYIYDNNIYLIFDTEGEAMLFEDELNKIGEIKEVCFYEDGFLEMTFKDDTVRYIDEFNCSILE